MRVGSKKNLSLGITVCHHSASLVMQNGDPRDGFFYPTLTFIIDSHKLACISSGSGLFVKVKNIFKKKEYIFFLNHNLTHLEIYYRPSQNHCIKIYICDTLMCMRGSRNFRQGGPGQSDKKALKFFFFFFVPQLIFQKSNG